jgi:sec-independent protein translocase protein TatC
MALVPFPTSPPARGGRDDDDRLVDLTDGDELDGAKMSFLEHLDELRKRLIRAVIGVAVGVGATFFFHNQIYEFVFEPTRRVLPDGSKLVYTQPGEAFSLHLQIALIAGVIVAAPYIMLQVWLFIAPGLYVREKKLAIPFVALSSLGFVAGAACNHYIMFPFMMKFFGSFNSTDLLFLPSLDAVFSLYTKFLIAMGLIFQMPTIVLFLARMRLVTAGFLLKNIKYAVLITFIVSAIITPTADPGTQTVFAAPMIGLYIISIGIAWIAGPKRQRIPADASTDGD